MVEVVENFAALPDEDRAAVAAYLKALPEYGIKETQFIERNLDKAKKLSSQTNVDFFEALSVMEATTREVTLLQGARDELDAQYLKNFHQ